MSTDRGTDSQSERQDAQLMGISLSDEDLRREEAAINNIRQLYRGVKLIMGHLPYSRKLSESVREMIARNCNVDPEALILATRLFDGRDEKVKTLRAAVNEVNRWYRDPLYTLPHVDSGVRRVRAGRPILDGRHEVIEERHQNGVHYVVFEDGGRQHTCTMLDADYLTRVSTRFRHWLNELTKRLRAKDAAAEELEKVWAEVVERQRARLHEQFNPAHYRFDVKKVVEHTISFPSLEADGTLGELDPAVFAQERQRIEEELRMTSRAELQRMEESMLSWVDLFHKALSVRLLWYGTHELIRRDASSWEEIDREAPDRAAQLRDVVGHADEPLEKIVFRHAETGELTTTFEYAHVADQHICEDQKPRKFNDATASRGFALLREARERKEELGISSEGLDQVCDRLESLFQGHNAAGLPDELRTNVGLRQNLQQSLADLGQTLFSLSELQPRRNVLRRGLKSLSVSEAEQAVV